MKQFEALKNIVVGLLTFDKEQIKKGFNQVVDNAKETYNQVAAAAGKVNDKIKEGIRLGQELDRLTKEYEQTQIRNAQLIPQLNAQLKEQNKIAEDTTKSIAEREAATRKTIELSQQVNSLKKEELNLELAIGENQAARNDTSREEQLKLAEIKGKIADADSQAAELQTTQQNKLNTIRKDAEAQRQKAIDAQLTKQKELLDLFIAEQGERARTLQEELALEETISAKRKSLLEQELKAKKISQEVYAKSLIEIDTELARQRAELAVDNAMREVEANKMSLDLQRENAQFLSQELAEQRKNENATILLQEQELAQLRLEQGLINQQEFSDAIRELTEANRIANTEIDKQREAIEKQEAIEQRAIDFENELVKLQEEGAAKFEIQQAQLEEQRNIELQKLAEQREQGALSEELYNSKLNAITNRYSRIKSQNEIENEKALAEQRLNIANNLFGALASVVDKNSAFGKALAISQAVINTYKGITAALAAPFPASIPAAISAAATGFAAVKNIVSTKVPKADGGNVTAGGGATPSADLSSLKSNESNLTRVSASGNSAVQGQIENSAFNSGLTESVTAAVRQGSKEGTMQGSEQGLTNLSNNKNIEKLSVV